MVTGPHTGYPQQVRGLLPSSHPRLFYFILSLLFRFFTAGIPTGDLSSSTKGWAQWKLESNHWAIKEVPSFPSLPLLMPGTPGQEDS